MSLGERLKMARKMKGLSQQTLGDKTGVSKMSISKYERGLTFPKSKILINLAKSLDVTIEYLLRPIEAEFSPPEFRKRSKLSKKQEAKIIESTHDWVERYLQVESLFDDIVKFDMSGNKYTVNAIEDVEEIAIKLREKWQLGLDPIDSLMEVLENNGIKVWSIDHDFEHFDALKMWVNGNNPVIVVKDEIPGDRQRFDLAHELGHIILNATEDLDIEKVVNRFSGAFLFPKPKIIEELGAHRNRLSLQELLLLKYKYGISIQALIYRAKDLNIISEHLMKRYFIEIRQQGWHKKEPGDEIKSEYPMKMEQLVHRALAESIISRSRAEELLQTKLPLNQLEK